MQVLGFVILAIVLILMFPRAAGFIFLLLVCGVVALFWNIHRNETARKAILQKMQMEAEYDEKGCSTAYPILVTLHNRSPAMVTSYSLDVIAQIPGRSSVVLTQSIEDDKIIAPGKSYSSCWAIHGLRPDGTINGVYPSTLRWTFRYPKVDW